MFRSIAFLTLFAYAIGGLVGLNAHGYRYVEIATPDNADAIERCANRDEPQDDGKDDDDQLIGP